MQILNIRWEFDVADMAGVVVTDIVLVDVVSAVVNIIHRLRRRLSDWVNQIFLARVYCWQRREAQRRIRVNKRMIYNALLGFRENCSPL